MRLRQFQAISRPCRYHSRKERMEPLSNGIPSSLMGISPKFPISNFQFPKVAYHLLKVSGEKSGRKVNDTCLFGSFRQKISGSNGTHLIRWSCFSGWNLPNGNWCSISSKPCLIKISGLGGCFSVNGTNLYKCKRFQDEIYQS